MELIGFVILALIAFVVIGIFGHLMDLLGTIIEWLFDGCMNSIGCLFWVVIIVLILISIAK